MNIMNNLLEKLEYQIGSNDLLELEKQRGFVERQSLEPDEDNLEDNINLENEFLEQYSVDCDEILGNGDCNNNLQ